MKVPKCAVLSLVVNAVLSLSLSYVGGLCVDILQHFLNVNLD